MSLHITHEVFLSQPNSFLAINVDSVQFLCSQAHNLRGWSLETRLFTLCCSIEFFFITALHGPHGKHFLIISLIVLGLFTAPLHSNGLGSDHIENSLSIVEACLNRAPVYRVVWGSSWLPTAAARVRVRAEHEGFVVDKVALEHVFF
jgi:hypothetical protein